MDATTDYALLFAKTERYLVIVDFKAEKVVDGVHGLKDYQIYEGRDRNRELWRYEIEGEAFYEGSELPEGIGQRKLVRDGLEFVATGSPDHVFTKLWEISKLSDAERRGFPVKLISPLSLPIEFTYHLDVGSQIADEEILSPVLPHDKLLFAKRDGDRLLGYFAHGRKNNGAHKFVFDGETGNLLERNFYTPKPPGPARLGSINEITSMRLTERNVTEWKKFSDDLYLAVRVDIRSFIPYRKSYQMTLHWWLDDEVPEAVFSKDDVLASTRGESVLDRYYRELVQKK